MKSTFIGVVVRQWGGDFNSVLPLFKKSEALEVPIADHRARHSA